MICPTCREKGWKSTVEEFGTFATDMVVHRYYDEDGKLHVDDPNSYTTSFTCSAGHHFTKSWQRGEVRVRSYELPVMTPYLGARITDEFGLEIPQGPTPLRDQQTEV